MTADKQQGNAGGRERKPVVLSKDEALYPPSKRAIRITVIAIIAAIILAVAAFILFPIA